MTKLNKHTLPARRPSTAGSGQLALALTTPVLSPARQAERPDRETRLVAARAVLARGLSGVKDDPAAMAAFLAFRARFHDYSLNNAVLIWMQRPTARYCMGFRAWQAHGRRVRKGERGLTVFAPIVARRNDEATGTASTDEDRVVGYRTAVTFDYEQTEATRDDALVYTPPITRLAVEAPAGLVARLEAVAAGIGYAVQYRAETGYADGWCNSRDRMITVSSSLTGADRASVITHELAHALAHAPASGEGAAETTRAQRELQAEAASFVALSALGLDTGRSSLPYLRSWAGGDDEALMRELSAIDRIARDLVARVEAAV